MADSPKLKAKEAQADVRKAEAEAKSARTPEERQAAVQKAEAKKTEAEAHKTEGEARKIEAVAKKTEAESKKLELEAKQAQAEAKQAKSPEQRAAVEKRAELKQAQAEVKKADAAAKQSESQAKQNQAEAKLAEAEAKVARSPGGRAVVEKQAEAKKAESDHKQAEAAVKKAELEVKKAEAEVKQAKTGLQQREAEKRAEARKVEAEQKRTEAEQKKAEADKKAEAHRVALEKRQEERRIEAAKAFAAVASASASRAELRDLMALRHELKTEALKPALNLLDKDPSAADLPPCEAGSEVCLPERSGTAPELSAQLAALNLPAPPVPTVAFLPQIQRKLAVVIGINQYADPAIPALKTALPDAAAVGEQLKTQLGYDVKIVPEASRADIVTTLNKISKEVGPSDSVTVYYAGHGYLRNSTKEGYWIPSDAKANSPANWISNKDISRLLANIPAKQVLLVSDSCYSGSLTNEQKIDGRAGSLDPQGILAKRTVTVMSSGGEEPVSDEGKEGHSIFAYTFMNTLKSVKRVDSGASIFEEVSRKVTDEFPQTPQYGGAPSAGHAKGGDYLFEVRAY